MASSEEGDPTNRSIAKAKTVYCQEGAKGPMYNGPISDVVNATYESGGNSFSGSHNRSTFERVITAGNDVHMPTTVQLFVNTPTLAASPRSTEENNSFLQQAFESALGLLPFRSPANRDAFVHPMTGEATAAIVGGAASTTTSYSIDSSGASPSHSESEETSKDRKMGDATGSSDNSDKRYDSKDCNVSSMSDLDLQSIGAKARTNAEIYTRLMLGCCVEGLPCWRPRPLSGKGGIIPGDVGTFNLTHGFEKLFNIWDEGYDVFPSEVFPGKTVRVCSSHFSEGHTIASGAFSKIRRSLGGQSVELFEFDCTSDEGAVLACTSSADLVELKSPDALKKYLLQYAEVIYKRAYSIEPLVADDSLYIVTGCIKSASWGLAAYQGATPGRVLRLAKRLSGDTSSGEFRLYDWVDRGTGEAFLWPNTTKEANLTDGKPHTLFLRGFTLAFSSAARTRLMSGLRATASGRGEGSSNYSGPESSGSSRSGLDGSSSAARFSSTNDRSTSLASGVQLNPFPVPTTTNFHPGKMITHLLLDMTGADYALSHDDDWRRILKACVLPSNSWDDFSPLHVIDAQPFVIDRDVAHFPQDIGDLDVVQNQSQANDIEIIDLVNDSREGCESPSKNEQASSGDKYERKEAREIKLDGLGLDEKDERPRFPSSPLEDYIQLLHNLVGGTWEELPETDPKTHTFRYLIRGDEVGRASATRRVWAKKIIAYKYLRVNDCIPKNADMEAFIRDQ